MRTAQHDAFESAAAAVIAASASAAKAASVGSPSPATKISRAESPRLGHDRTTMSMLSTMDRYRWREILGDHHHDEHGREGWWPRADSSKDRYSDRDEAARILDTVSGTQHNKSHTMSARLSRRGSMLSQRDLQASLRHEQDELEKDAIILRRVRARFRAAAYGAGGFSAQKLFRKFCRAGRGNQHRRTTMGFAEWDRALRGEGKLGRQHGASIRGTAGASATTVERLFQMVDINGDNEIDLQEWQVFLGEEGEGFQFSTLAGEGRRPERNYPALGQLSPRSRRIPPPPLDQGRRRRSTSRSHRDSRHLRTQMAQSAMTGRLSPTRRGPAAATGMRFGPMRRVRSASRARPRPTVFNKEVRKLCRITPVAGHTDMVVPM